MTSAITSATSTTSSSSTSSSSTSSTGGTNQPLGQDAFLKLLMAQLSNQDPLNPADGTQFVTQLAQFSLVEQSQSQSTTLGNISTQLTGLSNSDATALVGKTVTMNGSSMSWDGSLAVSSGVTLSGAATDVTATISDSSGNAVRTIDLGAQPAGTLSVTWDGHTDAGTAAPAGNYTLKVSATGQAGQSVGVTQSVTGVVQSVSFANGYPQVTLSNGTVAAVSQLVSVGMAPTQP